MPTPARTWRVGEPLSIGDHVARTYENGATDWDCWGIVVDATGPPSSGSGSYKERYLVQRSDGVQFEAGPFDLTLIGAGAA